MEIHIILMMQKMCHQPPNRVNYIMLKTALNLIRKKECPGIKEYPVQISGQIINFFIY